MTFQWCSFETELIQSLRSGHWPEGCDPELRGHVAACSYCKDLVLVTENFQSTRNASIAAAHPVPPGLVWWRAQLRRRRDATEQAVRPLWAAQNFAWSITIVVAIVSLVSQYQRGFRWTAWWIELDASRTLHASVTALAKLQWNLVLMVPVLGMLVLLSGIVLYLWREKE